MIKYKSATSTSTTKSMIDNMNKSQEELLATLKEILVGAMFAKFQWRFNYTITFFSRNYSEAPAELDLTICSDWSFRNFDGIRELHQERLSPLSPKDCSRAYVLPGLSSKEIEGVEIESNHLVLKFAGGVEMLLPLFNSEEPLEFSFILKTQEWVLPERARYVEVGGRGEILICVDPPSK